MLPKHVARHQSDREGSMDACPKCTHPHVVKAGKVRGKQRWLCRGGGYQFTGTTPRGRPPWQKSLAVFLYCHGVSMNALGKMFGVWASTILTWIRHYAAFPLKSSATRSGRISASVSAIAISKSSHQPTRQRERRLQGFKSPGHAQRFLSADGPIAQHGTVKLIDEPTPPRLGVAYSPYEPTRHNQSI
jgi:transposase-like protein